MIIFLVNCLVFVIDNLYKKRPYARFYVLETVARVPYFSYLSVLHLYETLGYGVKLIGSKSTLLKPGMNTITC